MEPAIHVEGEFLADVGDRVDGGRIRSGGGPGRARDGEGEDEEDADSEARDVHGVQRTASGIRFRVENIDRANEFMAR